MEGVERELAAAMRAALPLEAPYRLNFIGRYLLAQLAGEALPTVTNGLSTDDLARKMLMTTELEEELQRASEVVTLLLNSTKGLDGWPTRCVAERLVADYPNTPEPAVPGEKAVAADTATATSPNPTTTLHQTCLHLLLTSIQPASNLHQTCLQLASNFPRTGEGLKLQ